MTQQTEAAPGRPTVYVIESDAAVRDSIEALVGIAGYEPRGFSSAEEFLALATLNPSGCVVAEFDLPGMSGLELQERLAEMSVKLPIVFLASAGTIATAVRAMRAGAIDVIEKPFIERLLVERIDELLAGDPSDAEPGVEASPGT